MPMPSGMRSSQVRVVLNGLFEVHELTSSKRSENVLPHNSGYCLASRCAANRCQLLLVSSIKFQKTSSVITVIDFPYSYYGTTVFEATGLSNSYITQIILGSVNVGCTIVGLYIVQKCSRRNALMVGAAWIMMCFFVYAFVGQFQLDNDDPMSTPEAGNVLIVFSCLAIAAFATTWYVHRRPSFFVWTSLTRFSGVH